MCAARFDRRSQSRRALHYSPGVYSTGVMPILEYAEMLAKVVQHPVEPLLHDRAHGAERLGDVFPDVGLDLAFRDVRDHDARELIAYELA